tara:strand:+ start:5619 stop:6014 length:396 start_codon:yes stop_codon:yes gene_type:complete
MKKSELSLKQRFDYQQAYLLTREAIVDSIGKLTDRNLEDTTPRAERLKNREKILDHEKQKALLDARRAAFDANQAEITPPTDAQLDRLQALVAAVEQLNINQKIFDEVLALTKESLGTFNEIHPVSDLQPA